MADRVDSHQHFWQIARGDYGWLGPELGVLYRDFAPADLEPLMKRAGVERSIVVQAAPSLAETRYLLDLASEHGWIAAVVGWVDMAAPDAPEVLADWAARPLLCGVRPMIQDEPDVDWMLRAELTPAFRALCELDLCFDALVRPAHLANLLRLLERHPDLRVVVDHGAKPEIASGRIEPWATWMARIAGETDACCKLSGLVTEASEAWTSADIRPYMDHLLACFGPERMMWGSDWPVVEQARGYDAWWQLSEAYLGELTGAERDAVQGGTARRFYRLPGREGEIA